MGKVSTTEPLESHNLYIHIPADAYILRAAESLITGLDVILEHVGISCILI